MKFPAMMLGGALLFCANAANATTTVLEIDGHICTNTCFGYGEQDITPDYLGRFGPAFGDLMGLPFELVITNGNSYSLTINAHTVTWQQGDQHIAILFNDPQTQASFGTGSFQWTDQQINDYGFAVAETLYGCPDPVPGVPEPSTWAMMLIGFAGLGGIARRMRKRRGGISVEVGGARQAA